MQQKLFDTVQSEKVKGLTISKAGKQKLSKNQEAFNKLTQKIEKLQKEIEKKQFQLDLAMKLYGTEVHTSRTKITEQRRELIVVLWDNFKTKNFQRLTSGILNK